VQGRGNLRSLRRRMLGAAAGAAVPLTIAVPEAAGRAFQKRPPGYTRMESDEDVGRLVSPDGIVLVLAVQDPYQGQLVRPTEPNPAKRYLAVELELRSTSEPGWFNGLWQFGVRDTNGTEYIGGNDVVGSDPRLFEVELPAGESARGWLYIAVPKQARLTDFFYYPRLRLPWPGSGDGTAASPVASSDGQ
jgi:hypothetical protein